MLAWTVVGAIASAAGLAVGIWVLSVASGARQASEEARKLARQKDLVEELEQASERIQQMGLFAKSQQAHIVQLRANEVIVACSSVLTRWPDHLGRDAKNALLTARTKIHSIASVVSQSAQPSERQWKAIASDQLEVAQLIAGALGDARRTEERGNG
jgi:hypothetical protein